MRQGYSIAQFYDLMRISPARQAILLEGETGIGKTTIVKDFAENVAKLPLCTIQVSEGTDMVDVFGLPDISGDHTIYKPPSWYIPGQRCVLFMDEVNRNKTIMKGLMRLATDQRIGDLVLPDGSYVFGAINPEFGQKYQVVELDPAHRARFMLVELNPTVDEWLTFARKENVHHAILEYIEEHGEDLDSFTNESNMVAANGRFYHNVLPCRRQWHALSPYLYNGEDFPGGKSRFDVNAYEDAEDFLRGVVSGLVGVGVADRFVPFYYASGGGISAIRILEGDDDTWSPKGELVKEIRKMADTDLPSLTRLTERVFGRVARSESELWNALKSGYSELAMKYSRNVYKFLHLCPPEVQSNVYFSIVRPATKSGNKWPNLLCNATPALVDLFTKACTKSK